MTALTDAKVFVSYAREDRAFVDKLVEDLAFHGVRVWRDSNLAAGVDLAIAITEAMDAASVVLFVLSRASAEVPMGST